MSIINEFIQRIENALNNENTEDDFDIFNSLESWFLDNEEEIHSDNYAIGQLGYKMQDQIAEMSYMDDNSVYKTEIQRLLEEMKQIVNAG